MTRNRGHRCGDIELVDYLVNMVGPVPLVMDLHITHDCWGSRGETTEHHMTIKIREYRPDYSPSNSISFIPVVPTTSGHLHYELVRIFFCCLSVSTRDIETTIFDPASEFLNHIDEVRNPAFQRCFYKPSRN